MNGCANGWGRNCKRSPTAKAEFFPLESLNLVRKRRHRIHLKTTVGNMEIKTWYGQDRESGEWHCPLRRAWGLEPRQEMSPELEERLCFTAALTGSFEAASQVAWKWGVGVSDSAVHHHVKQAGERALAREEMRVEDAHECWSRPEVIAETAERYRGESFSLVIEMDGWMVRERGECWGQKPREAMVERVAWHEVKTATIFRLENQAQNQSGRGMLLEKFYVAYRGDPHEFGRRVYAEALRRGLVQARQVYVVADGGVWIWSLVEDRFSGSAGVLDFYHASQHLWAVARALFPEEKRARGWVEPLLHQLRHGEHVRVVGTLEKLGTRLSKLSEESAETVRRERQYFISHRDHLDYESVSQEGCPVGSGAVESTCSQLQDRFKRTGQFWSLSGERYLMALELARRNDDWDEVWLNDW